MRKLTVTDWCFNKSISRIPQEILRTQRLCAKQLLSIKTIVRVGQTITSWVQLFLASKRRPDHAQYMFRRFFQVLAIGCTGLTGFVIWHPGSLQVTEAIISRYIDPCGLLVALNCTPFLWHPLIATLLSWPAGLVGFFLTTIFWFFGRPKQRDGRSSKPLIVR
jgi:hypothetical protein